MLKCQRIHFIGIGGVGMSALAWVLARQGFIISGSDISENNITQRLRKAGVKINIGHRADNIADAELVIFSSAIPQDNPELIKAKELGLPIRHRAELLGALLNNKRGIVISGTHGKTTTTSMISLLLREAGLNPTILIGGELKELGGNAEFGEGEFVVAEADESDGSFLNLRPEFAIITNIEEEHLDYYKNLESEIEAFINFAAQVKEGGIIVTCLDDYGACRIIDMVDRPFFTYSVKDSEADIFSVDLQLFPWGSEYMCVYKENELGSVRLAVPGMHNVANSLAALGVGLLLGLEFEKMTLTLANFHGAARRFEVKSTACGITVIDDYAHHPTEVATVLGAAKKIAASQGGRLFAIFQPHRFTRTYYLSEEFGSAFNKADFVVVTDIYPAGETPIEGISGEKVYNALRKNNHPAVIYLPLMEEITEKVSALLQEGDVVITLGAGDIWTVGEKIISSLPSKEIGEVVQV